MSIECRNTAVANLFVNSVSSSSIVQMGDNGYSKLTSRAIAVARAIPNYVDDEFRFAAYPIFFLPRLTPKPCFTVSFQSRSPLSGIRVGSVRTLGVAASSLLRAGCGGPLQAEARIKHIRHFNYRDIR